MAPILHVASFVQGFTPYQFRHRCFQPSNSPEHSPGPQLVRSAPRGSSRTQAHRLPEPSTESQNAQYGLAKEAAALAATAGTSWQNGSASLPHQQGNLAHQQPQYPVASSSDQPPGGSGFVPQSHVTPVVADGIAESVSGFPASGKQEDVERWLQDLGMSEDTLGWARTSLPALFDITVPQQVAPLEEVRPPSERPQSPPGVQAFHGSNGSSQPSRFRELMQDNLNPGQPLTDAQLASNVRRRVMDGTPAATTVNGASYARSVVGGRTANQFSGAGRQGLSDARSSFLRMNQRTRQQQRRKFKPSPQAGQVMAYLYSLGLNDDNLYWIQLLVPELFELDVDKELKPSWRRLFDLSCAPLSVFQQLRCVVVWEFLTSLGMRHEDIHVIAMTCPSLFTSSLSEGVEPIALLLNQLGIPKIEVGRMFATTPELFFLDIEERIDPVLYCLRSRVPDEFVGRIVNSYPGILALTPEVVASHVITRMEWLLRMRVDREYVISLLGRRPTAFTSPLTDAVASRGIMEELGFTKEQMEQYLPSLMDMAQS